MTIRDFTEYSWATVFNSVTVMAIAPKNHFEVAGANRHTVIINRYMRRICKFSFAEFIITFFVESDNSINIPVMEQLISGKIITGGVVNESIDFQIRVKVTKLGKRDNKRNRRFLIETLSCRLASTRRK